MEKWKCSVCGYTHEGPLPQDFKCPVCKVGANKFVKVHELKMRYLCWGTYFFLEKYDKLRYNLYIWHLLYKDYGGCYEATKQ